MKQDKTKFSMCKYCNELIDLEKETLDNPHKCNGMYVQSLEERIEKLEKKVSILSSGLSIYGNCQFCTYKEI